MGMGPNGKSLLEKLGVVPIADMSNEELLKMLESDRSRRGQVRKKARIERATGIKPKKQITLEELGFEPDKCLRMRLKFGTDELAIKALKEKGLL